MVEGIASYWCHRCSNVNGVQSVAVVEAVRGKWSELIAECNMFDIQVIESELRQTSHRRPKVDVPQGRAASERMVRVGIACFIYIVWIRWRIIVVVISVIGHALYIPVKRGKTRAVLKSIIVYCRHRVRNRNLRKLCAIRKRIIIDSNQGIGKFDLIKLYNGTPNNLLESCHP